MRLFCHPLFLISPYFGASETYASWLWHFLAIWTHRFNAGVWYAIMYMQHLVITLTVYWLNKYITFMTLYEAKTICRGTKRIRILKETITRHNETKRNQSADSTGGSIVSDCRVGKWSWTGLKTPLISCYLSKQCRPWSDYAVCGDWSGSALFANVPGQVLQIFLFTVHSDVTAKNSQAINSRYLDFVQTRDLILLVSDKHVDKNTRTKTLRKVWCMYT